MTQMMKLLKQVFVFTVFFMITASQAQDWANLEQFKADNTTVGLPIKGEDRVVFMGNSIGITLKKIGFREEKEVEKTFQRRPTNGDSSDGSWCNSWTSSWIN